MKRHGNQDQRRAVLRAGLVFAGPRQEAERDIQRVCTAFLERVARRAVEVHQPRFEFVLWHADENLAALQGIQSVSAPYVLTLPPFVDGLTAWVGAVHQIGSRQQLQRLPVGQQIFQRAGVRHFQFQGLLAGLEVEQVVAQRKVQQLALPAGQTVLRVERGRVLFGGWFVLGQFRRFVEGRLHDRRLLRCLWRRRRLGTGQRFDALQTCPTDVDRHLERLFLVLRNLLSCVLACEAEARRRSVRGERGFEQQQLLQFHPLAQRGDVVHDGR